MNITYFLFFISISFCIFMFFYFIWYIKRRTSAAGLLPEYRTEVYRLIAEIDAATDRDSLLVEDRIKKLKEILEDTDKRLSVYTKELERSRTGEALYTSLGRGIRAALNTDVKLSSVLPQLEQAPLNKAPLDKAPFEQTPPEPQIQKPSSKRQIRSSIDLLANEGLPPAEIASRLNISIAEVELAMNLRRPADKKNGTSVQEVPFK